MGAIMALTTNRIVDIHNHSLPLVDDGATSLEEATTNIKYLKSIGITDIVLTSHYIINSKYQSPVSNRKSILKQLQDLDLGVNLYLGNEVFISDAKSLISLLKENKIASLNHSKYLLIEFPRHQIVHYVDKIICELNDAGYTPIIAHPERYSYYWHHFNKLKELLEYDCIFQCNIESIAGKYGRNAKKTIKKLLKDDLVCVLATDFHHLYNNKQLTKALNKLNKLVGSKKINKLLVENPLKIIENKKV